MSDKVKVPVSDKLTLTIDEAAGLLGVCGKHLRQYIDAGELRSIRLGTRHVISRAALEQFVAMKEGATEMVTL